MVLSLLSEFMESPSRYRSFHRRFNFSGCPGAPPETVLAETQRAILEIPETGLSLLSISPRSSWFREVVDEAEDNLRSMLRLPKHNRVLFLPNGSAHPSTSSPASLMRGFGPAGDHLETGCCSAGTITEARKEGVARVLWNGACDGYTHLPSDREVFYPPDAGYFHYVSNESVEGLQFHRVMGLDSVPRICDMSSDFLSRPIEAERFALLYADARMNLGKSGVTVVVLRDDLLQTGPDRWHDMRDDPLGTEEGSIPTESSVLDTYVLMLVTRWLRWVIGGIEAMAEINRVKAKRLYAALDASDGFYGGRAAARDRSWMNVVFNLPNRKLEQQFLREARAYGLHGLEGHRTLGGVRASLYNAVPLEAVETLCEFMEEFRSYYA